MFRHESKRNSRTTNKLKLLDEKILEVRSKTMLDWIIKPHEENSFTA